MTNQINPRDWEALSAYLDGQLAPKERQRLEARLQTRADCVALEECAEPWRVTVTVACAAASEFHLTPEMAGIERSRQGISRFLPCA
jgi:anti-sigma factor RsiW